MNNEKYSPVQLRWWLTRPYSAILNEMQYRHTRTEFYKSLHHNALRTRIQVYNFILRTAMPPTRFMWADFNLLFHRPGNATIINGNEQLSLSG